jgi:uncharacterized lipoprotein YddW (UPF0748 family)
MQKAEPRRVVQLVCFIAFLFTGEAVFNLTGSARSGQAKALWVVRTSLLSSASIDQMVSRTADAGFDNLFVQVCGRADAYFPSRVYPPAENCRELLDSGFDPLAYVIQKAHARGIKVHAWINTLLVWSNGKPPEDPGHVLNRNPEWMMTDRSGSSLARYSQPLFKKLGIAGVFLSPARQEVTAMLEEFILDLVSRYPVDGIHLDYIRYPMETVDFSPEARKGFQNIAGVDPRSLFQEADRIKTHNGEDAYNRLLEEWKAFRAEIITVFLARLAGKLNRLKPQLVRSAAVKPEIVSAFRLYGQDWPGWVRKGYLDMVLPMAYSTRPDVVYSQISQACEAVGGEKVWVGLRVYDVPVSEIIERVRKITPLQPGGYCFFSYDGIRDNQVFFRWVKKSLSKP